MSTFNYRVKFSSSEDEDDRPSRRRIVKTIFDSDDDEEVSNAKATTTVKTTTSKQDDDDSDSDEYKPPRRSRMTIFDDSSEDEKQPVSKQDHLYCFSKPVSIDAETDRKSVHFIFNNFYVTLLTRIIGVIHNSTIIISFLIKTKFRI